MSHFLVDRPDGLLSKLSRHDSLKRYAAPGMRPSRMPSMVIMSGRFVVEGPIVTIFNLFNMASRYYSCCHIFLPRMDDLEKAR